MPRIVFQFPLATASACMMLACATKEVAQPEDPAPKIEAPPAVATAIEEETPLPPPDFDDGIRLPDERLLAMPDDDAFRATVPAPSVSVPAPGSVTVRPPTDPPARPKPPDSGNQ